MRRLYAEACLGTWLGGEWCLERVLGVGGTSAVFAGRRRDGTRAALKVLHPELAEDARVRARFLREVVIADRIDHPAVVRVLDDDDAGDQPFLVLELVEGRTLAELTAVRPLPQDELLDVADQLLDALAIAHAAGVVHGDIKPQNLLLDQRHRLRVLDFGIARLLDEDVWRTLGGGVGDLWGTLEYMAPEQLSGTDEITPRTDVYAVGATLFWLASRQHVHEAAHPRDRVLQTLSTPAPSLATVAEHFDPGVVRLVDRATQRAPEDRWQSALEMLAEVRRLRLHPGDGDPRRPSSFVSDRAPPTRRDRPPPPGDERDESDDHTTRSGEHPGARARTADQRSPCSTPMTSSSHSSPSNGQYSSPSSRYRAASSESMADLGNTP
jgi:serine/threonine-protein kinase